MPRLSVGEYAQLAGYGDAVRAAHAGAMRDDAISVVVHVCARYHERDIPWAVLAVAVGVTPGTLRQWRQTYGPGRKDPGSIDRAALVTISNRRSTAPYS